MSSRLRSSSVGASPRKKPLSRSRAESEHPSQLEVRCACQYFQTSSLEPERAKPVITRPTSSLAHNTSCFTAPIKPTEKSLFNVIPSITAVAASIGGHKDFDKEEDLTGSALSFGTVITTDYYAEVSSLSRPTSRNEVRITDTSRSRILTSQEVFQPIEVPTDFSDRAMSDIAISIEPVVPDPIRTDVLASRLQKFGDKSRSPSRSRINMERRMSEQAMGNSAPREDILASRLQKFTDKSRSPSRSQVNMKRQMSDQAITNDPLLSGAARAEILASRLQKFQDKSRSPSRSRGFMERQMSDQILTKDPLLTTTAREEVLASRLQKFADKSRSPSTTNLKPKLEATKVPSFDSYKPPLRDQPLRQRSFDTYPGRERRNSEGIPKNELTGAGDRPKSELLHLRLKKFPSFTERDRNKSDTKKPRGETPIENISRSGLFNLGPQAQTGKPLILSKEPEIKIPVEEKPSILIDTPTPVKQPERAKTPEKSVINVIPAITAVAASISSPAMPEPAAVELELPKLPPRAPTPIPPSLQIGVIPPTPLRDFKPPSFKPVKPERISKKERSKTPQKEIPMETETEGTAPKSNIKSFFGRFGRSRTPQEDTKPKDTEDDPDAKKARVEAQKLSKAQSQDDKERNLAMESMMMDHYDMPTSKALFHPNPPQTNIPEESKISKPIFSSQRSLDKYSTSTMLQRYKPKSASQAPSQHGSQTDLLQQPQKMTKTVSFDYGKPLKMENGKLHTPDNFNRNEDHYHRMSPMVFPVKDNQIQTERIHNIRDHEYEPIGEPPVKDVSKEVEKSGGYEPIGKERDSKLTRTATEESEEITAQDFQADLENRFFSKEVAPIENDKENIIHPENIMDEAVVIDEEPVKRSLPTRKRNLLVSAQEQGKNFKKKIRTQAGILRTTINNKIKKRPKEKPVAVEVKPIESLNEDTMEAETQHEIPEIQVQEAPRTSEPTPKRTLKMPKLTRPEFTKNISKPQMPKMPKFKKPEIPKMTLPDRPKMPDMPKIKMPRLGRSRSLKESSVTTENTESSVTTPEPATAIPTKKKFDFDFRTYPRLIKDKFKRQKLDRSDRSVRADTPPALEFKTVSKEAIQRGPVASRWLEEEEEESGKYQHFESEQDVERESSVERRIREQFEQDEEDFATARRLMSDEQRQMDEFDRENQQIHEMARQEKPRRAPPRQESETASEEDKMFWSGSLNKDAKELLSEEPYKFTLEDLEQDNLNRSVTPATNVETQSSGSSGQRRRKGVIEEIDDDEFFLRKKGISQEHVGIGEYISEAIKEGLSEPVNGLAGVGSFDAYYREKEKTPEKPQRSLRRNKKKNVEDEEVIPTTETEVEAAEHFRTFPPDRPIRKQRKSYQGEEDFEQDDEPKHEQEVPYIEDFMDEVNNNQFYDEDILKAMHEDLLPDEEIDEMEFMSKLPVPPTPPRRRKKKIVPGEKFVRPIAQPQPVEIELTAPKEIEVPSAEVIVYRSEHESVPLAQQERYTTPTPTPTPRRFRSRSRSQISGRTSHDADSIKHDSNEMLNNLGRMNIQSEGINGYAVVRKDAPPRPPAPVRRKRSTKSLGERQFATMPHIRKDDEDTPVRPIRAYSTISPSRPPRRKSATSLGELNRRPVDDDEYEEIDGQNADDKLAQDETAKRLQSGDVISKMKDRPLPPPPRPKRDNKKKKVDDDEKFDKDGGAEQVIITLEPEQTEPESEPEIKQEIESEVESPHEMDTLEVGTEEKLHRMSTFESDFSESSFERPIEVEVSTQTDPVLDEDFLDDDEDIDLDDYIRDGKMKTLEEILKEEQEAEIERARQLAEAENLSRGIQRFRESSQRSYSERSRTSADGRKTPGSGRITPAAVVVEHKKSSPIIFNDEREVVTEASLFVHPIEMERGRDEYEYEEDNEKVPFDEPEPEIETQQEPEIEVQTEPEILEVSEVFHILPARPIQPEIQETPIVLQEYTQQAPEPPERSQKPKKITIPEPEPEPEIDIDFEALVEDIVPQDETMFDEIDFTDRLESQIRREIDQMVESIVAEAEVKAEEIKTSQQELFQEEHVPPVAPPRKKSLGTDLDASREEVTEQIEVPRIEIATEAVREPEISFSQTQQTQDPIDDYDISSNLQSNRLHLSSLEIDNLSVSSLQAGRITVSELDSNTITTNELDCKSGSLVTRSIEIPPGLIEEIVERVMESTQQQQQQLQHQQEEAKKQEKSEEAPKPSEKSEEPKEKESKEEPEPPQRPPPPNPQSMYPDYPGYSVIPPSFYQMRNQSEEEQIPPQASHRRRRQVKRRDSTSEEEYQKEHRTKSHSTRSPEPSVAALGGQFLRACGSSLHQQGSNLMAMLRASSKDENKRDLHVALIILIVIVAGLMMLTMGDKNIHHHHWDYFNPPDNQGRKG